MGYFGVEFPCESKIRLTLGNSEIEYSLTMDEAKVATKEGRETVWSWATWMIAKGEIALSKVEELLDWLDIHYPVRTNAYRPKLRIW